MKFKISKKIVSLFLAVMMVVTSVPSLAMTAFAGTDNCKYLFAYFTGDTRNGQNVRFALSEDGYTFTALNNNYPVATQTKSTESSTSSGYARDPYITRDPNGNGYYMVATDMDASGMHSSWSGDSCVYVWHSNNLVDWTQISNFDFRTFSGFENTIRAWAPQIIWDSTSKRWMMYLSITVEPNWNVMYYTYTTDFKTFTAPKKFEFSTGVYTGRIDADIIENNGKFYMYYKDETAAAVMLATADSLTGTYTPVKTVSTDLSKKAVEGNAMYQLGNSGTWVMMLDEYANGSFAYGTTTDFVNFTKYTGSTSVNSALKARHGSVMQITDEEYNRLKDYKNWLTSTGVTDINYSFNDQNTISDSGWSYETYSDTSSGRKYDVMLSNRTGVNGNFKSGNGYVKVDSGNVFINEGDARSIVQSDHFAIAFTHTRLSDTIGNENIKENGYVFGVAINGTDYLSLKENGKLGVNIGGSIVEAQSSIDIPTNVEQRFVVTYDGATTRLYIDGVLACSVDGVMSKRLSTKDSLVYTGFGYTDQAGNTMTNMLLGPVSFYDTTFADDEILSTMSKFEDKVKNVSTSQTYTNIGNAYNSYVNCQKVYDSYNYGGKDDIDIAYYVSQLKFDVASMTETSNEEATANVTPNWVRANSNVESGYYSNILYALPGNSSSDGNDAHKNSTDNNTFLTYRTIKTLVFMLDGNQVKIPTSLEMRYNSWAAASGNFCGIFIRDNSANTFSYIQKWQGYDDTGWEHWPNGTGKTLEITNTKSNSVKVDNKTSRHYKNYLVYNAAGNTSSYYDNINSITYGGAWRGGSKNYELTGLNWYFINYKDLSNGLNSKYFGSAKNNLLDATINIANYSEGGASNVFNIANCVVNPSTVDYSDDIDYRVQVISHRIKNATSKINSLTSDTSISTDSQGYASLRSYLDDADISSAYTGDTSTVYTSDTYSKFVSAYTNARKVMFDVYNSGYIDSSASTAAEELKTAYDALKKIADLDKSAYNAAVADAQAAIENTAKYTETSRNELQSVLNNNKLENAKSQTELDAMTKAIETAYNTRLVLNQYTINLYTVIDDVVPATPTETIKLDYGEEFTFDSKLSNDYTVQKWVRNVNGSDEKVGSSVTSLTGITYANASYYVYAVKAKDTKENNAVVSLKDRNNRVVDNMYVELKDGTANLNVSVDVNKKCVTVNGAATLNAIDLTFYNIVGFKINGVEYKENKNISLDINGDLTIETLYDIANSYTITTDDSCSASVTSAYWDQKVTVTAKNGSANTKWYVDGKVVAYGPTYTFRATRNISISCANNDDAFSAVATVESLSYNNPIEKTITVVGSFNVPEDCTVVEKGVLMKTSSVNNPDAVRKIENYTGEKANARKFIAKNYVKDTNQYVINVYSSKAYTDLCVGAVAYVTYTDASGHQQTAYSDLVVFNQNNA